MSRIAVPFGQAAKNPAVTIAPEPCGKMVQAVTISITGPNSVWISDNQNNLDLSVDSSGTPQNGILLTPGATIATIVGTGLWARSDAAGAFLDIWLGELCAG